MYIIIIICFSSNGMAASNSISYLTTPLFSKKSAIILSNSAISNNDDVLDIFQKIF